MATINRKWPWPTNMNVHGTFPEEVKALQELENNPDAAPIPELAPTNLLTPKRSSDNLRFGEPERVSIDDAQPNLVALNHVVLRRLRLKRNRDGWQGFSRAIETEALAELPKNRRDQMKGMRRREEAMLDLVDSFNKLAEGVYGRLLSESKG